VKIGPNGEIPLQIQESPIKIKNHSVFPNPGRESFTLSYPNFTPNHSLKVFDMQGRLVFQTSIKQAQTKVDASSWPSGLYHYTVQNGKQVESGKWMKE